ncbi:hypothetical protein [Nonomuraea sp. NPDC003709]|uniref:hypothetical protein n=1 Tax=Nonomuraea sp. NPDC003709 TaxID=3154450 RepID=UPI0033A2787C
MLGDLKPTPLVEDDMLGDLKPTPLVEDDVFGDLNSGEPGGQPEPPPVTETKPEPAR